MRLNMSKKKDLAKNTLIIGIGKISTQLVSFILLPLYTIYLSPGDYGFIDLALTYVLLIVPAVTMQMEMAVFRFLIDARSDENRKREVISNAFRIVCVATLLLISFYSIFSNFIYIKYGWYVLINICATIFSSFFLQVARGLGDNKKYATASIISGIAMFIFAIFLVVVFDMGVVGILASIIIANLICLAYILISLNLKKYINLGLNSTLKRDLMRYSIPLIPNGISFWVINASDRTILSIIMGLAANGIYAVSNKFSVVLMSIFGIFNMSWTESISLHIKDKDSDKYISDIINHTIKGFSYMGLLLIAFVPILFKLFIGKLYFDAINYVPILVVGVIFNIIVSMYGAIYVARKETMKVANTTILASVFNISLTLALVKPLGLYGASIATAASYLILMFLRHYDIRKSISIHYNKLAIAGIIVSYLIILIFYYMATLASYIICIIAAMTMTAIACRKELQPMFVFIKNMLYNKLIRKDVKL